MKQKYFSQLHLRSTGKGNKKMNKAIDTFTLKNGVEIPCIGFGTWQTPDNEAAYTAIETAIAAGYRHIDTAKIYKNEESVGNAIKKSIVPREELFITGKVWNTDRGYETTLMACKESLKKMQLEYFDLYLIHWPASFNNYENWEQINVDTWKAMTDLYKAGMVKSIGVSNFMPHHLRALMDMEIVPMVNQIEFHPGQMEQETVHFCRKYNIVVEAYSPLGTGRMLDNAVLKSIGKKYNKTAAQICLRWAVQNKVIPLPKSITPDRIKENIQIFDFELSADDMDVINSMEYFAGSGHHPDSMKE